MTDLSSIKFPPIYKEGNSYAEYTRDLDIWLLIKVAQPEEQGPLVHRTLTGKSKAACRDLTVTQIGSANGLKLIRERLDKLYLGEQNLRIYNALDSFEKFKRPSNMTVSDFIFEFESLHAVINDHKCQYPDGVLAYKLIKAANLSTENERLCRATVATGEFSYTTVVEQLKKLFNEIPIHTSQETPIKLETAYHTCCGYSHESDINNTEYIEGNEYEDQNNENEQNQFHEEHDIYYTPSTNRNFYPNNVKNSYTYRPPNSNPNNRFPHQKRPFPPHNNPNYRSSMNRFSETRPPTNGEYKNLKAMYSSDPNTPNPKDNRGNHTICRRCKSIYHWITDCPHNGTVNQSRQSNSAFYTKSEDEVYIALLQSCNPSPQDQVSNLTAETLCHGVIDSGCSKTVAGRNWLNDYLSTLPENESQNINFCESNAVFRFGDSSPVTSEGKTLLPVIMGGKKVQLETEIVSSDIPLLLSKDTMKSAKAKQDYENDCISLFGKSQDMICTKSGHYAIPICSARNSKSTNLSDFNIILYNFQNSNEKSSDETARKLHHQFGHPSSRRLINYIKTAGINDSDLFKAIENVSNVCNTCKRYKRVSPRPIVTFPLATNFNETVALDLKIYENNSIYFIHVIDHATRFSAASIIRSKKSEVVVNAFFKIWISIFGTPGKVLSDNGGEFANSEFVAMCESLNINYITTAAEAPWSNGLVERHNAVIGEVVNKILEEVNCSLDVALCWAVNAKNSLQNIYGFSPYQLVFGQNPTLPTVLTSRLPALEGITESKVVAEHLNALHQARQEFIKAEASEKIRRAMKAKTRTHTNVHYLPGDEVFYKRESDDRWKGPGRVIGQDGTKVLVKTPCSLISVHSCRICLTGESEERRNSQDTLNHDESNNSNSTEIEPEKHSEDEIDSLQKKVQLIINEKDSSADVPVLETNTTTPAESNDLVGPVNNPENLPVTDTDLNSDNSANDLNPVIDHNIFTVDETDDLNPVTNSNSSIVEEESDDLNSENQLSSTENADLVISNTTLSNLEFPKRNQCIKYRTSQENDWSHVKYLNRAGKATGKYNNWLNVKNIDDDKEYSLDWNQVSEWQPIEHHVFLGTYEDKFEEARVKELNNWKSMNVYQEVEDTGQPYISVRWVYKEKIVGEKTEKKSPPRSKGI